MAGNQYALSSPLSICSNSILNSSMFYSLGASHIFVSSAAGPKTSLVPRDYMFYAWCVNVMQSVPGCGTVCRRWIVIALYPIDIRTGYVFYGHLLFLGNVSFDLQSDYGVLLQNKPMLLPKLSSVCVGDWDRMWVGFSLVAFIYPSFSREAKKLFLGII